MSVSRILRSIFGVLAFSLSAAAVAASWVAATPYNNDNYHTKIVKAFLQQLNETEGIATALNDNNSLIKHKDLIHAVGTNQVQLGEVVISAFSNDAPIFAIDSVPFLTSSTKDVRRLWNDSKGAIEAALSRRGVHVLFAITWPPQGMYLTKRIDDVAALKGLRFRSLSPMSTALGKNLGVAAVQIEAPDIPQAFATGMIDGMFTSAVTGVDSHVWEYAKYFYNMRAWQPLGLVIMNKKTYDALDSRKRTELDKLAGESEARGWAIADDVTKRNEESLETHGVTVVKPSSALTNAFREAAKPVEAQWLQQAGPAAKAILEEYRAGH